MGKSLVFIKNEIMEFTVSNVKYKFDHTHNTEIPNYDWFVNHFKTGEWEKDTFDTFEKVKDLNKVALDIGAWIGPTSIWLSKNFKKVISVEVDKNALKSLKLNLKNNDCENVMIVEKALFNDSSNKIFFGKNTYMNNGNHGDSASQSKIKKINDDDYLVDVITINELFNLENNISFIKIDIEGGEENILDDLFKIAHRNNIKIWISFHYSWWLNKDTNRFNGLIYLIKKITHNRQIIDKFKFFELIKGDPFGSFLIEF